VVAVGGGSVTTSPWIGSYSSGSNPTSPYTTGFWPTATTNYTATANTVAPGRSGTAAVGSELTGTDGTWTGSPTPTLSRKWQRSSDGSNGWVDIEGATSSTYTLVSADADKFVRFVVTGSNVGGSATVSTSATARVTDVPANSAAPIVSGTVALASELSTTAGTWTGAPTPTISYKWQRSNTASGTYSDISGATSSTYTVTASDAGKYLRSFVTATNSTGTPSKESAATIQVPLPSSVYVSPSGNDTTGQATSASPVATIQRALDIVESGGTVNVKSGTYTADLTVSRGVTLKGSGTGTKTIAGTSGGSAAITVSDGASGSSIQDLTITAASGKKGVSVTTTDVTLTGLSVGGSGTVGIEYSGADLGTATTGSSVSDVAVSAGFSTAGIQVGAGASGTLKVTFSSLPASGVGVSRVSGAVDARDNWWNNGGIQASDSQVSGTVDRSRWIHSYTGDPAKSSDPGFWPTDVVSRAPTPTAVTDADPTDTRPVVDTHVEVATSGAASATVVNEPALQSPLIVQPPFDATANQGSAPGVAAENAIKLVVEPNVNPSGASAASFSSSGSVPTGAKFLDIEFRDIATDQQVNLAGPFTICLVPTSSNQRLWHYEDSTWVDITNRQLAGGSSSWALRDTSGGRLCGQVAHFSPFGVAADEYAAPPTITPSQDNPTSDTTPSFSFAGETDATFTCSLDGADYAACSSPYTVSPALADGSHTLRVKQTDPAGNLSDARVLTFEVDTTAPDAPGLELFTPASASQSVADTGTFTREDDAKVVFSSHDPDTVTYECKIDSAAWADCDSPLTAGLTGLSDGAHTVKVHQIDEAGNVSADSTVSWTVDTGAPSEVTYDSPFASWTSGTFRGSDSETITWSLPSDSGTAINAVCSVDGGPDENCDSNTSQALSGLSDGVHSLKVTVVDAAGNRSSGVTISWTTDTQVPEAPDLELFTPKSSTVAVDPTGTFTQSDTAKVTIGNLESGSSVTCTLDSGSGAVSVPCASPAKELNGLGEGDYTFSVTQTDSGGNESVDASVSWVVDRTAPDFATDLQSTRELDTNWRSATLSWVASDNSSAPADVVAECALYKSGGYGQWNSCSSAKSVSNLPFGVVKFKVRLRDQAGNVTTGSDIQQVEWNVVRLAVTTAPVIDANSRDDLGVGTQVTTGDPDFTGETTDDADAIRWEQCSSSLTSSCTTTIVGTTGTPATPNYNKYTPTASDIGKRLRYVVVRTTDDGSTVTTASGMSGVVTPVVDTRASISGTTSAYDGTTPPSVPAYGRKLTAVDNTWTSGVGSRTTVYRWQRCADSTILNDIEASCKTISGAAGTASTYTPASSDVGRRLRVLTGVCISSAPCSKYAWSSSTVTEVTRVVADNVDDPTLVYKGGLAAPKRLKSMSVKAGAWRYTLGGSFTYRWQRCTSPTGGCSDISAATKSSYVPTADDVGKRIRVRVVYTGRDGTKRTVYTGISGLTTS